MLLSNNLNIYKPYDIYIFLLTVADSVHLSLLFQDSLHVPIFIFITKHTSTFSNILFCTTQTVNHSVVYNFFREQLTRFQCLQSIIILSVYNAS